MNRFTSFFLRTFKKTKNRIKKDIMVGGLILLQVIGFFLVLTQYLDVLIILMI